jgi:tetratricopeptide (TPR) repeat protein
MPAKTYMVNDARNDHSIRIPRPDISLMTDSPNACTNCHQDQTNQWAADQVQTWYGKSVAGLQAYALAFFAGRNAQPGAGRELGKVAMDANQPSIARASALAGLSAYPSQQSFKSISLALKSEDTLERMGALTALQSFGSRERVMAFPLLSDKYKSIRIEAARVLAALPAGDLPLEQKALLDRGVKEYIAAQQFNADRPEAQVNLGNLYSDLGRYDEAELAYKSALELQSQFEPAYANLAQFYSNTQREQAALEILDRGLAVLGNSALLHHAKGLSLIRLQQTDKAMESLAKAARLGSESPRYAYVFAVALNSTGRTGMALNELAAAHLKHPQDRDILTALVTINRDAGNRDAAKAYAEKLLTLNPDDLAIRGLVNQL